MLRSRSGCLFVVASAILLAAPARPAQKQAGAAVTDDASVVRTWFERLNALDGTPPAEQAFVSMYEADALHTTAPARHQMGSVTYRGHDGIRKMAASFAAAFEKPAYRIESVTANEKSVQLFNMTPGPWGGNSVAVEFVGVQTDRQDGKRWVQPGAAFFQLKDGKIRRLRIYMATGELAEVEKSRP